MKSFVRNNLFGFLIGIILCSGIVYATNYYAKDVSYEPTDASWEVNNVEDALNSLYEDSKNKNNEPFIKNIDYVYYSHTDWGAGRRTETLTLTIEPNGANSITLNLNEDTPTGSYSEVGSAAITAVTNGTFSGATITPEDNTSDVIVTVSVTCGTVIYSGATFTRHLGIVSYT